MYASGSTPGCLQESPSEKSREVTSPSLGLARVSQFLRPTTMWRRSRSESLLWITMRGSFEDKRSKLPLYSPSAPLRRLTPTKRGSRRFLSPQRTASEPGSGPSSPSPFPLRPELPHERDLLRPHPHLHSTALEPKLQLRGRSRDSRLARGDLGCEPCACSQRSQRSTREDRVAVELAARLAPSTRCEGCQQRQGLLVHRRFEVERNLGSEGLRDGCERGGGAVLGTPGCSLVSEGDS